MTDLEPLQPDADDDDEEGFDSSWYGDPWPVWCERVAIVLVAGLVCLVASAVLIAIGFPITSGPVGAGVAARLRIGSQYVGPLDPLVGLGAVLLVAADGITSGERRGPATSLGRIAVYTAGVTSVVVAIASLARLVDVLAGHISPVGPAPHGYIAYRFGIVLTQIVTVLIGAVTGWVALRALDDRDRDEPDEELEQVEEPVVAD